MTQLFQSPGNAVDYNNHQQDCHPPSMQDQITCQFWFKITPTQIIQPQSHRAKPNSKKSVLIKLGTKEGKTKELNKPIELEVDILFSKTLQKFCPIKGIIKIYDINEDGTEMISCVGSFNTEELVNQKHSEMMIERDIGHFKIKMIIEVKEISKNQEQSQEIRAIEKDCLKKGLAERGEGQKLQFMKGEKISEELECHETPYIIDDSIDVEKLQQISASYCSDYSDDFKQDEKELIGQQLIEQRRNNKLLEEKVEKGNMKIGLLKRSMQQKNNEIKSFITHFQEFTANLQSDAKGQYIFEINERKKQVCLRYRENNRFRQNFVNFLSFMTKKIKENQMGMVTSVEKIDIDESTTKLMRKIQSEQSQKIKMMEQNRKLALQINKLKKELKDQETKMSKSNATNSTGSKDLQFHLTKKNDQLLIVESKLRKSIQENKSLLGMNQYLQEKDTHMESIINSKENTIENLKRMITDTTTELDTLEEKNGKMEKLINNYKLTIEEMKQENANLLQTIEEYREKFGDLKAAKDKALERELRDCLRWIDQENRNEELSLEENTLSFSDTYGMNSIMKGIDQIENMPLEEISVIRKEVVNVLKKLDELIARNNV